MTDLTRRDALLITAAAAAVAPAAEAAAAAPPPYKLLSVPTGPISDGSAIPIGITIPGGWFESKTIAYDKVDQLEVALSLKAGPIATFKLKPPLLLPAKDKRDISFATRIKVAVGQGKAPVAEELTVALSAIVAGASAATESQTEALAANAADCAPAPVGLLRVSVQPPAYAAGDAIAVKAMVPQPMPLDKSGMATRHLTGLTASVTPYPTASPGPSVDLLSVALDPAAKDARLADEVFVSFNLPAPFLEKQAAGLFALTWTYDDGIKLQGTAHVAKSA